MGIAAALALVFTLSSPAFANGGNIPARYTCDAANVSPPLRWNAPPRGTRTLSLSVVDVDASASASARSLFIHWQVRGIPARVRSLPVGAHVGTEGMNSFGTRGWSGPCPPRGRPHHYVFVLHALDAHGHELGQAGMQGLYARR